MTFAEYLEHYTVRDKMLIFLGIAILCTIISVLIIILAAKMSARGKTRLARQKAFIARANNLTERYYEMIFSATSILSFLSAYYLIERFVTEGAFYEFWDAHSDMLLLVMIILSCVINSILDRIFIRLKNVTTAEKGSVRLIGMLYIILIFMYIKFIYENDNYDGFIIYFLGLMVGRYAYFDSSFSDFVDTIKRASHNIPLLLLGLANTGIMCLYGFGSKYLLRSNGVLVSTFFAHLFLVAAIFIVYHTRFIRLFVKKPAPQTPEESDGYYDYGDEQYEDENYGEDSPDYYEEDPEYYDDYEEYDNYDEYDGADI